MARARITNPAVTEALEKLGTPDLTYDNASETHDEQATHMVDVWYLTLGAYGRAGNHLGQRVWYHFTDTGEAEEWFDEKTKSHRLDEETTTE